MNIYYVYFYLRADFTPYYVGKGKNNRAYQSHKKIAVPKDKSRIIFIKENLTEIQSFILERYYIRWFGRKDNGTGILRNMSDGGEGNSGYIRTENSKDRIRKSMLGKPSKLKGTKRTKEFNNKISKGQILSENLRSDNKSGYKGIRFISNRNKWEARITINKKIKLLGQYTDLQDAIKARTTAELEYISHNS